MFYEPEKKAEKHRDVLIKTHFSTKSARLIIIVKKPEIEKR